MAKSNANWQTALYKIAQATREGKVKWRKFDLDYGDFNNAALLWSYETEDHEPAMQIYRISHVREEGDTNIHASTIILEFVDHKGNSEWRFPDHPALEDIASAVQYQANGIDQKLAKLFKL